MKVIKRVTALLLSLATVGSIAFSSTATAETESYDDYLDFNEETGYVSGISDKIKASQFNFIFKNANGKTIADDAFVGTGATTEKDGKTYILTILGDVSGDGQINSTDFMQVRKAYLGLYTMADANKIAADINGDGNVNSTDFMQIRKHFLGTYKIEHISYNYLLKNNQFASLSLESVLSICERYYSLETHILQNDLNATWGTTLWPFGSFMEALSETYKLYPENETIKTYLLDTLDNGLNNFKVTTDLVTPAGEFKNITYYNASAFNHGDYYYDDNAWICLQFLEAYELFGDEKYLTKAEEILAFFETGIDDVLGGGLYWDKSFTCKNTCADGPAAIGYLLAYKYTGNEHYLARGKELVDWLNTTLRDPEDGRYYDNQGTSGEINTWKAYYNQGTPLYALCLLFDITGEKEYLTLATQTIDSVYTKSFRTIWDGGPAVAIDGGPIYKVWCVGWLYRGVEEYVKITDGEYSEFYDKMNSVVTRNLKTKDEMGYYDPYFGTGQYSDQDPHEVLQVSGMTSVLALQAYYEIYIAPTL